MWKKGQQREGATCAIQPRELAGWFTETDELNLNMIYRADCGGRPRCMRREGRGDGPDDASACSALIAIIP